MIQSDKEFMWREGLGQAGETVKLRTSGQGLYEITEDLRRWLADVAVDFGLLTVFIRHTSASLTIQENADPDVKLDLMTVMDRLAPRDGGYIHSHEGPDDMPAHIKTVLTDTSLSIPVQNGDMVLGTWQGVYVWEHRDHPHTRSVVLHYMGSRQA